MKKMIKRLESNIGLKKKKWACILSLSAMIIIEITVGMILHRDMKELWKVYRTGAPSEKTEALFILSNRNEPDYINRKFLNELLQSDEVLLREAAMTVHITRFTRSLLQKRYIKTCEDRDEKVRCRFFLRHSVGKGKRSWITQKSLEEYFSALEK